MREGWLTRTECTAMKGIAILGIMLHNYCHWLKDIVRENEFTWLEWKVNRLTRALEHTDDLTAMHLMSFFGHYGVAVFLFLSGYGLVRKYETAGQAIPGGSGPSGLWRFTRYNYLKLFRLFIVGFVLFTMLDAFTPGIHRYRWDEVVAMLGMYANFFEDPSHVVWPGPYWYFSITLQLYLLYRLLMCRRHWGIVVVLIAACWLWQYNYLDDKETLERLRYNFIGGMLPFGVGVLAARLCPEQTGSLPGAKWWFAPTKVALCLAVMLLSFTAVYRMSFDEQAWLWIPVFVITGVVALVKLIPAQAMPYVVWLGSISAAIFVTHPLVRKIFYRPYYHYDQYAGLLLYIVATLVMAWLVKKVIDQIPSPKL